MLIDFVRELDEFLLNNGNCILLNNTGFNFLIQVNKSCLLKSTSPPLPCKLTIPYITSLFSQHNSNILKLLCSE
jgi:hypothetical protein